jgi:hypothetical protein
VVLIGGLFGHRGPDDPVWLREFHAVTQWTAAHWAALALIVPVLGLIAAGIVNHYLALSRENRARRLSRSELRARVHADLAARLLSHCAYVQGAIGHPQADPRAWRPGNTTLRKRGEKPDVVEALGHDYVPFMAAIEKERRTIEELEHQLDGRGAPDRVAERVGAGAREIVETYVPFICDFGEERQARRLSQAASDARHRA